MPQQGGQAGFFAQSVEVFQTFSTQCVQYQEALYIAGFIEATLSLFDLQVPLYAAGTSNERTVCTNNGIPA